MNTYLLGVAAVAMAFGSVLIVSLAVVQHQRGVGTRRSLMIVQRFGMRQSTDAVLEQGSEPTMLQEVISSVGMRLVGPGRREALRRNLAWAGRSTADDLVAQVNRKVAFGTVGLGLGCVFALQVGALGWLAPPVLALAGFYLPDLLVYNRGLKRAEEIQQTLPDALDLLNLCVESGLSLQAALNRVALHQQGPVAVEFGRVLHEMQLGVSRSAAFESLATRSKQPDMQRFVAAMLQVDKLGIPVAAVLREQALEMRKKRHARARELAQKVPVKILAPLLLCFLPGLFIVVLGPAVVNVAGIFAGR
jgi:tight adherence protein C